MRTSLIAVFCFVGLTLTSCNIGSAPQPDARQAGRDAYKASQDLKKDAKEAARQLQNASKEFREGWKEAQQRDANRHDADRQYPKQRDSRRQ
jgi:hypothetical protein